MGEELHYALNSDGDYQIAPGDLDLAQEHRLPENFPASYLPEVERAAKDKGLTVVVLNVNLHTDVM